MKTRLIKISDLFVYSSPATKTFNGARGVFFASIYIFISGCMGSTYTPAQLSEEFSALELCRAAIFHGVGSVRNTDDVIAEINRRRLISASEWQLVNTSGPQSRKLKIGMSECSMLLVMDNNGYEITETVSEFGVNRLYEFGHDGYGPFIFVDNNKVTSWTY